ncbi:MAG: hypothetical protein GY863_02690 [bacterium]|nr:hypothetical protein [bacterium]
MFLRFVHLVIKEKALSQLSDHYSNEIIPSLHKMPGCMYAGLIHDEEQGSEAISMTIWDSKIHAEAYERSGVYKELLGSMKPYLADSSEWKIRLSREDKPDYLPAPDEPVITAYDSTIRTDQSFSERSGGSMLNLRIVSLKLHPSKIEELKRIYSEEVIPVLQNVKGCKYVFLTEGFEEDNRYFSVTLWESKQDADNYEKSGLYNELLLKIEHTFADVYEWKMGLGKEKEGETISHEDIPVDHYGIVTGKSFE